MTNEPDSVGSGANYQHAKQSPRVSPPETAAAGSPPLGAPFPSDTGRVPPPARSVANAATPLNRGFGAYGSQPHRSTAETAYPQPPISRRDHPGGLPSASPTQTPSAQTSPQRGRFSWFFPWRTQKPNAPSFLPAPEVPAPGVPAPDIPAPEVPYSLDLHGYSPGTNGPGAVPPLATPPRLWERQPYSAISYLLMASAASTTAWLLGILIAQILPGSFENPPIQESFLRKSGRLTRRLWHVSELWQTPTAETRITAIPLPETGPVISPLDLSPIERQPLIDELNAVETEILTLDRRLQGIERRLGKPPYQGVAVETRVNTLRAAIDPPVREAVEPDYEPVTSDSSAALLEVAELKITLPSDALFSPGASDLRNAVLLRQVLDQLVNYPDSTISVRSYSDDQADAIASREYTLAQANAIAAYLTQSLPTAHRWVTVGVGQSQPSVDNTEAISRQQNRRIEILVDTR
ncbi:MAG: OmpA family protein [Cyanobacteria bacterium J06598_1]